MSVLSGELRVSSVGADTFLVYRAKATGTPWERDQIIELLREQGVRTFDAELFDNALSQLAEQRDGTHTALVARAHDGGFAITIDADKLVARLSAHKARGGGKPLSLQELGAAILRAKMKNLDKERVRRSILEWHRSDQLDLVDLVLVEGSAPRAGTEGSLRWLHEFTDQRAASDPELTELWERMVAGEQPDSIDDFQMSEVTGLARVTAETALCTVTPAETGEAGIDVYGVKLPGLKGQEPELELFENVRKQADLVLATVDGIVERGERNGVVKLRVRPLRDAAVDLRISEDGMEALMSVAPPVGIGRPADLQLVQEALQQAGIRYGVEEQVIAEALRTAHEEGQVVRCVVARGTRATPATPGRIEFKVRLATGKAVTERSDGSVDHKMRDLVTIVRPGEVIAEIHPPTGETAEGTDVCGTFVDPPEPEMPELLAADGVREKREEDGRRILYAEVGGQLLVADGKAEVHEVYVVSGDVGVKSGNVRFAGAVQISGDVQQGYSVFSGADLSIDGAVDRALVSAGGAVSIGQGVIGGGKAIVRAKQQITAQFAEQATLMSVDGVQLNGACLRCTVKTNGRVQLGTERGDFIGGVARAREGLLVRNLGSERGTHTEVSFGQNYLVADKIEAEERELEQLKERSTELTHQISARERKVDADDPTLRELHAEKVQVLKAIEAKSFRVFTLQELFEEHSPSNIVVAGTVYPGVVIESHGRFYDVKEPKTRVVITFDQTLGQIDERVLEDRDLQTGGDS